MPWLQTMTDEGTEERPRGDPRACFDALSREHAERLRSFVRRKLGAELRGRLESEDIVQEVLTEAFQRFLQLPADADLSGDGFFRWLEPMAEHRIQSLARFHLEAKKRSPRKEEPFDPATSGGQIAAPGRSPSSQVAAAEQVRRLHDAVAKLTPREREVVTLVHLQKLRVQEAAARMGWTPNAASVLLHEALTKLRGLLGGKEA
jgi:RNA polymerase sigma-70 factor (subfamily 1)